MPFAITIEAESPEEIRKKLKKEYPQNYQEASGLGAKLVRKKGLLGLFQKKMYQEHFVILDRTSPRKGRNIDIARQWLAAKAAEGNRQKEEILPPPPPAPAMRPIIPEPQAVEPARASAEMPAPLPHGPGQTFIRDINEVRRTITLLEKNDFPRGILPPAAEDEPSVVREQPEPLSQPDPLEEEWIRTLLSVEVDSGIAKVIVRNMKSFGYYHPMAERDRSRKALSAVLGSLLKYKEPVFVKENERKVVMLIGPTGVGKTTTLVKICADLYRRRIPLRFMTIDTYRVGATGQLEAYTEIIRAPLDIIRTAAEFKAKIAETNEQVVFVDTAGRSPRDEARRKELLEFVQVIASTGLSLDVLLVLSAMTAPKDMEEITSCFTGFPISGVIITKTDEPFTNGRVVNYLHKTGIPAVYFTNGQSVPEDLLKAGPEALCGLLLQ